MTTPKRKAVDPWDEVERKFEYIIDSLQRIKRKNEPYFKGVSLAYKIALDIVRRHRPKKGRKK